MKNLLEKAESLFSAAVNLSAFAAIILAGWLAGKAFADVPLERIWTCFVDSLILLFFLRAALFWVKCRLSAQRDLEVPGEL